MAEMILTPPYYPFFSFFPTTKDKYIYEYIQTIFESITLFIIIIITRERES